MVLGHGDVLTFIQDKESHNLLPDYKNSQARVSWFAFLRHTLRKSNDLVKCIAISKHILHQKIIFTINLYSDCETLSC